MLLSSFKLRINAMMRLRLLSSGQVTFLSRHFLEARDTSLVRLGCLVCAHDRNI